MTGTNAETVRGRFEQGRTDLDLTALVTVIAVISALGFALLFLQEPLAHDAMHNFRHAAGVTCH